MSRALRPQESLPGEHVTDIRDTSGVSAYVQSRGEDGTRQAISDSALPAVGLCRNKRYVRHR